ncbi:oxysterol-binding protein-related protein 8-like isoform X3 [Ruditapes philippinarum]|uniref:oxysterol-binding protein-related protein 8-like isoform X3 n=1 Tax=Ruditapes philippinarum TaxID=129788 RepID=UPI00295BC5FA|nr:oxysterol-binding protein-related protein 8-like isoform X3 [Ruditapes philippinarum]
MSGRKFKLSKSPSFKLVRTFSTDHHHAKRRSFSTGQSEGDSTDHGNSPQGKLTRSRTSSESKLFSPISEKLQGNSLQPVTKISKRESLKEQKRNYRSQKKQAARELLTTLKDPSVIVLADWLKVRGTLKSWTKLWCVLKPGLLVLYKSEKQKSNHWVGTVLLNTCRLIERPSKKDGFCFKIFHPLDQSIWATKGPKGETIGAIVQPLPYSYLIFRAPSEAAGKCWMDALELSLRCTNLLMKSMKKDSTGSIEGNGLIAENEAEMSDSSLPPSHQDNEQEQDGGDSMDESDCEKHFANQGLDEDYKTDREEAASDSSQSEEEDDRVFDEVVRSSSASSKPSETPYIMCAVEELGQQGDSCQTEEVNDENKSIIWTLMKQVRPGMDLSKVVLPTFILEPRSFLDKLTDYYYHCDILSEAVLQEDPYTRIKSVVKWYLSGFYKKPKGLKKPYNPIIGETYRCYWHHPNTNSRTFYIAEQLSHHPPVTGFYVSNRKDGFNISGSILAKSKFYGNSLSALLDGTAKLSFLKRGEDYYITMPYAHCKGILIGTLTMEMGGKVSISCPKTGYRCDLEFKLKPFLGIGEASNKIVGKLKMGSDTLAHIDGHWDQEIYIKDKVTGESSLFFAPTPDVKAARLKKYTVPIEIQTDMESERLWKNVSDAIIAQDMHGATQEKFILEERQRQEAKERKAQLQQWIPKLFERDSISGDWIYKHIDMRPWDITNDKHQYESEYLISTWTKHRTPVVRTLSITSLEQVPDKSSTTVPVTRHPSKIQRPSMKRLKVVGEESGSSAAELDQKHDSDSSEPGIRKRVSRSASNSRTAKVAEDTLAKLLEPVCVLQQETNTLVQTLQRQVVSLQQKLDNREENLFGGQSQTWIILGVVLLFQTVLQWLLR